MAYRKINDTQLTAIADAVRAKLNAPVPMKPDEMPGLIEDIGVGYVPDYWRSYLAEKAQEINAALDAAGSNRSAFLWYTDAHWKTNYGMSPMLLRYLSKHTGIDKTYFGGDIAVDASGETDLLTAWLADVSSIPNHRSMIGNHDNNYNTDFPTAAERAEFFLQTNRTPDMAFGTDITNGKMYYYVDDHIEQTRYIILSTGRMWTYADEVQWCIDTLLSTPSGWHIVAAAHLWLNNDYNANPVVPLETPEKYAQVFLDLFDAYNYRESGTTSFASTAYDFTNAKAKVEFVIGGHIHQDYDFATAKGIPVILTECDAWQERDEVSVATKGTTTESCVYAIVADYTSKLVNVINVGRGDTRSVAISDVDIVTYTNVLPLAIDTDGNVYNASDTPGYKANTRLSGSSGYAEKTQSGIYTTGFIPVKTYDTIRLKNMQVIKTDSYSAYAGIIYYSNNSESIAVGSTQPSNAGFLNEVQFDENGYVTSFVVGNGDLGDSSTGYMRISAQYIGPDSVITVNEEIS